MCKKMFWLWLFLVSIHLLLVLFFELAVPGQNNAPMLLVYGTVLVLNQTGLPLVHEAASGWAWAAPNIAGWAAGVLIWLLIYAVLAGLVSYYLTRNEIDSQK